MSGNSSDSGTGFHIDTTINYRIQSVDFLSYIELTDYPPADIKEEDHVQLEMRPFKVSTKQQWRFVPVTSSNDAYYIQNVAKPQLYIGGGCDHISSSFVPAVMKTDSPGEWEFSFENGSHTNISCTVGSVAYLYIDSSSSKLQATDDEDGWNYENHKWNLLPVPQTVSNDSLTAGYYRIRSFNGSNLLTMSSDNSDPSVFIDSHNASDPYQRWAVTPLASERYSIQNSGTAAKYLGCTPAHSAQGDTVTGLATMFEWDLRSFGSGLTWSINLPQTQLQRSALSIGFAHYFGAPDDKVSLQPSDTVPSQMWFFEKYVTVGIDRVHAKRQVEEASYYLQNSSPNISMNVNSHPWRITNGRSSKFTLKYEADSPQFKLEYTPGTPAASTVAKPTNVADRGGYLGIAEVPTLWILLEHTNEHEYYICRADSGYPRKVISGRITTDIDDNQVFAIDDMIEGEAIQAWKLNKVD